MGKVRFKRITDSVYIKCPACEKNVFVYKEKGRNYIIKCVNCKQKGQVDKTVADPVGLD
ncbi:MAG: hypothetical protein QF475_01600 [Candidatus Undinarchaeales archaeon]|jgi:uncharacterized Zn finger protein|nr:hypothetical protein [Candidatus Undinarchaeales archaeon]